MSNTELMVKRKRLSKEIRKTIVDLGIRKSDASYLIKNLLFNNTKQDLVDIVERDDIPIAVQIYAHALLNDYKTGKMGNAAAMMQWAFENTPEKPQEDLASYSPEELDKMIEDLSS